MNRRSLHALLLLVLAGLSLLWFLRDPTDKPRPPADGRPVWRSAADSTQAAPPETTEAAGTKPAGDRSAASPANLATGPADPARHRRAYLLSLDGTALSLVGRQDIEGDFAPPREQGEELWPGMLRCRLVAANGAVLAEEVMPAPDQLCAVQDRGKLVTYRTQGPVIFQTRLPRVANADRLEVTRIADRDATSPDILIGSIDLTP